MLRFREPAAAVSRRKATQVAVWLLSRPGEPPRGKVAWSGWPRYKAMGLLESERDASPSREESGWYRDIFVPEAVRLRGFLHVPVVGKRRGQARLLKAIF